MEIYEYMIIAFSPAFLFFVVYIMIGLFYICCGKGKWQDLVDFFIFNVFPDVLKTKRDDTNNTKVYFRMEKVLLQGDTLSQVKKALFNVFWILLVMVALGFGILSFLENSYDCQDIAKGKDCFEYPLTSVFDAVRANCSDPDILQGKKLVLCYRLVFQLELAVGVSYGMYQVCTVLLSVGSALIIKIDKEHIKKFKIVVGIIISVICITVLIFAFVFRSHSFVLSFGIGKMEFIAHTFFGMGTMCFFVISMPWVEIIEQKNRSRANPEEATGSPENSVQRRPYKNKVSPSQEEMHSSNQNIRQ